ncbi:helix-turn-helix transcriptional regulator [Escherichia coli]|nr:helix-turn-helix transcriptional regulator [Escherichia coli]EFA0228655.1 helix-turn-helix transcriptional regulator [Escherichia coli]
MTELAQLQASAEQAAALLKAMSHPKRLLILCMLSGSPGTSAGELTRITGLSASAYSAAIFLIPICISFDTAEKRRYATYLILNRRFSFEF